jgi:hypothetical protein
MRHLRFLTATLAGVVLAAVTVLSAAPASFAARLIPPPSGGNATPVLLPVVHSHPGLATWEVTLIALGAALFGAILTATVMRARLRAALRPAH